MEAGVVGGVSEWAEGSRGRLLSLNERPGGRLLAIGRGAGWNVEQVAVEAGAGRHEANEGQLWERQKKAWQ